MERLLSDLYVVPFWMVVGLAFGPELALVARTGRARPEVARQDRGSIRLIVAGLVAAIVLAVVAAMTIPSATIQTGRETMFWMGLAVIGCGAILRQHCFRMLGQQFRAAVEVREGQAIVSRGAYRWVRHPSYAGCLLLYLGLGLALTNWVSIALLAGAAILLFSYRIRIEEAALIRTLGAPYVEYMGRTKRLIPFLF